MFKRNLGSSLIGLLLKQCFETFALIQKDEKLAIRARIQGWREAQGHASNDERRRGWLAWHWNTLVLNFTDKVDQAVLDKNELVAENATLAEEKHASLLSIAST